MARISQFKCDFFKFCGDVFKFGLSLSWLERIYLDLGRLTLIYADIHEIWNFMLKYAGWILLLIT